MLWSQSQTGSSPRKSYPGPLSHPCNAARSSLVQHGAGCQQTEWGLQPPPPHTHTVHLNQIDCPPGTSLTGIPLTAVDSCGRCRIPSSGAVIRLLTTWNQSTSSDEVLFGYFSIGERVCCKQNWFSGNLHHESESKRRFWMQISAKQFCSKVWWTNILNIILWPSDEQTTEPHRLRYSTSMLNDIKGVLRPLIHLFHPIWWTM